MTIVAKFSPDSEIAKLKALGVKEREKPRWQVDRMNLPFTRREYDHQFKVITRGLKKRV
jgi:hypothetical protein